MAIGAILGKIIAMKQKATDTKGALSSAITGGAMSALGVKGGGDEAEPKLSQAAPAELPQVQGDITGQGPRVRPFFMTEDGQGGFRVKEFNDYLTEYLGETDG